MARIPAEEIERLKADVAVERLVEASGVALKAAGKDLLGRCPFHEDREASLVVTPAKNLWHCFGCQIGGGPIDWVMKQRSVSFRHAVELLRNGSDAAAAQRGRGHRLLPAPVALDAGDQALMDQAIRYYQERLKQTPEALAYLARRGLDDTELIERHRLGFADRTLGLRLPEKTRKAGHEIRSRLQKLGLLRESGHEHFNGSIVIPVITSSGEITEVYGRKINDNLREGTPYHLYLPGPHRGVWNEAALESSSEIILCEALIDALTFWRAGYRNVTAAYGIEGFTADHLAAFQRHGTKRVLIAYDRDEAGDRAAEKLAEKLIAEGLECYRIQFPHGMDANEYALKVQPAAKSLGIVIRKAAWLGKGPAPTESPGQQIEHAPTTTDITPLAASVSAPSVADAVNPAPASPPPDTAASSDHPLADEVIVNYGERRYRVRGLSKNLSYETLKINLHIAQSKAYYVDTFDLYSARSRHLYIVNAATDLAVREEIVKADLGRLLLKLEALQQSRIEAALKVEPTAPTMSEAERDSALDLLRDPKLLDRILADYDTCGLIGERTNKLVGYLAAVSRKLERPLAVVVQSSSAAGKSSLMDAVLAFVPAEERIKYSAMTGQSLFYMGETNLKHKILAIVEEEGASRASYALKLLQSEGELTIASTGKDPATGNLITQEYRVEGPVMIFLTTTAIEIDEELMNRCLVLSVDESREQTQAIHRLQRERCTLAGLVNGQRKHRLLAQHSHAQRLLRPLKVLNPYADRLTFLSDKTRTRRDHEKYLTLIDAIALLHQYQRPLRSVQKDGETIEYIEATLADIEMANRLAHEVLGRSLDELPPQTRRVLARIVAMVEQDCRAQQVQRAAYRFSRRQLREHTGLSDTQLRVHLERLVALEYLLVHRGMRGQSFVYELVFDGPAASEAPHLSGLIDVATMASSRGSDPHLARSTRGHRGPNAAGPLRYAGDPETRGGFRPYLIAFTDWMGAMHYSAHTVKNRRIELGYFIDWCEERSISRPDEVTRALLERYRQHVFHYRRKDTGTPLSFQTQHKRLISVRMFFQWLTRQYHLLFNPASELELPRTEQRLPRHVLNVAEVEQVINAIEVDEPTGLGVRDRAMLETLYSTGMRRGELVALRIDDVDLRKGTVFIRLGKGKKDRVVPIGERACAWIEKYLYTIRPRYLEAEDPGTLFLAKHGGGMDGKQLSGIVKRAIERAALERFQDTHPNAACHLLRHACATHMLESGADIRYIQALLGHADLSTTEVYTRVSILKLKEIHEKTHPARLTRTGSAVLDALEGEIPQLPAEPSSLAASQCTAMPGTIRSALRIPMVSARPTGGSASTIGTFSGGFTIATGRRGIRTFPRGRTWQRHTLSIWLRAHRRAESAQTISHSHARILRPLRHQRRRIRTMTLPRVSARSQSCTGS